MVSRKSKRGDYVIEELSDIELSPEMDAQVKQMTDSAEAEIAATRVSFRWEKQQLDLVKRVAEAMGVPYQTYMKQAVYRQAIEDISKIEYAHLHSRGQNWTDAVSLGRVGNVRIATAIGSGLSLGSTGFAFHPDHLSGHWVEPNNQNVNWNIDFGRNKIT